MLHQAIDTISSLKMNPNWNTIGPYSISVAHTAMKLRLCFWLHLWLINKAWPKPDEPYPAKPDIPDKLCPSWHVWHCSSDWHPLTYHCPHRYIPFNFRHRLFAGPPDGYTSSTHPGAIKLRVPTLLLVCSSLYLCFCQASWLPLKVWLSHSVRHGLILTFLSLFTLLNIWKWKLFF